ncbi:hypothetical protein HA402_015959 [Bradysia odoriphaga]|nr:hypothetical protein HA402_015959 [Bradysia odoriphaga]
MRLNAKTISDILEITNGQTNNVDWFVIRKNRITASNFGKIINSANRNRFPPSLFSSLYGDSLHIFTRSTRLTRCQSDSMGLRKILKTDITTCGIFLGASPDGIIDENYVVEIKCPFKYRDLLLSVVLKNDTSYIVYWDSVGRMWLNKKHPYYHQIQGQIYLSNRKGCHLCIWTPKQAVHCLILKDETWANNLNLIEQFYFGNYVPYIESQFH